MIFGNMGVPGYLYDHKLTQAKFESGPSCFILNEIRLGVVHRISDFLMSLGYLDRKKVRLTWGNVRAVIVAIGGIQTYGPVNINGECPEPDLYSTIDAEVLTLIITGLNNQLNNAQLLLDGDGSDAVIAVNLSDLHFIRVKEELIPAMCYIATLCEIATRWLFTPILALVEDCNGESYHMEVRHPDILNRLRSSFLDNGGCVEDFTLRRFCLDALTYESLADKVSLPTSLTQTFPLRLIEDVFSGVG